MYEKNYKCRLTRSGNEKCCPTRKILLMPWQEKQPRYFHFLQIPLDNDKVFALCVVMMGDLNLENHRVSSYKCRLI